MIIANPIFDTVFKRLMENERIAKFFIGTLLEKTIEKLEVGQQEITMLPTKKKDGTPVAAESDSSKNKVKQTTDISLMRLDYVAVIKTETGYTKVLIEVQKVGHVVDMMRFRNYLGAHYSKTETIEGHEYPLPIITIYVLGFNLYEIESACVRIGKLYEDLMDKKIIKKKNELVESLTHESYFVQTKRIPGRYKSVLDKLLSAFEQKNFIKETKQAFKHYSHQVDNDNVRQIVNELHRIASDPDERKRIEIEQEAWRTYNVQLDASLEEKDKIIAKRDETIKEKDQVILELKEAMEQMKGAMEKMTGERELERKERELEREDRIKEREAKDQEIKNLTKLIEGMRMDMQKEREAREKEREAREKEIRKEKEEMKMNMQKEKEEMKMNMQKEREEREKRENELKTILENMQKTMEGLLRSKNIEP
jgi:hypothetical protein